MPSLVYHTGALGDFVTTLPAFELWKREHPSQPLVLLGRPAHGALARHVFDETWDAAAARFSALFSPAGRAGGEGAGLLAGITSALVFAAASSPLWKVVSGLRPADAVRQDPFPAANVRVHIVDYHLELFGDRVRDEDRIPTIPSAVEGTTGRTVALHHGSGSPKKNWPRHRFEALAAALAARGWTVAWITGPAEESPAPSGPGVVAEEWRSLDLADLARRLSGCRLFVGNDSGVTHLAAAAGCPALALFGAHNDAVWAPRGRRVVVIRSPTGRIDDVSGPEVLDAALDLLGEDR